MKKTVIVTGGSRGIGAAAAKKFAEQGCGVVINYLKSETAALELQDLLTKSGCEAVAVKADVSDRSQVDRMIAEALDRFGSIDILINNAGIAEQKLFTDITESDWNRMVGVHLTGTFHCCQAVLPTLIHQKSGCILNISSIWGMTGASCEVHYSAAKAGVIGMTRALAKELGPSGIRVNCVAPGIIDTDMNAALTEEDRRQLRDETPMGVFGTPGDIADTLLFLASDRAKFITGQVLSPNGGFVIG